MSPRDRRTHNTEPRLQVVAVGKLHLAVDSRSLCRRFIGDAYSDEAGLRAWNDGPLGRCGQCATALVARSRNPAPARTAARRSQTAARTAEAA